MIVMRQKHPEDILGMIKGSRNLLITSCCGCGAIVDVGDKSQAENLKAMLEEDRRPRAMRGSRIKVVSVLRQCDSKLATAALHRIVEDYDAVLSLACGVGVQAIAEAYPNKHVIPVNDTMFLGRYSTQKSGFSETCRACGNCILFETGGICPTTRCAKSLLNGPCGGQVNGKCEADGWKRDCAWILIYERLKEQDRLDLFRKFRVPRDYRVSESPRELPGTIIAKTPEENDKRPGEDERSEAEKREAYGELMKSMMDGKFVITGELEPLKTTNLTEVIEVAKILRNHVEAINITDNPTAFGFMNALVSSYLVQKETGVETVYQMTTRDRNRLALLSDILAAGALGIKNILVITGDHTTVGDTPQAKPVFDLDSATLVYMLRRIMDEGLDLNGNKIENPPKFNVGVAASPNADPLEAEIMKIERKVKLGIDFIQTQCVYSVEQVERFLDAAAYLKTPVLPGIAPFKSLAMMDWMIKFVPGIRIPTQLEQRLRKAREKSKEAFHEENVEVFADLLREIHKTTSAAGVHLMAVGFEWIIPRIIERSGIDQAI